MGERLAALKSPVQARKIEKVEKVIKNREDRLKKAEKSLKDKPDNKFAPAWQAQVTGLTLELSILNELKQYDPSKDKISDFVRKKLGLFAPLEDAPMDAREAKVRECFEQADTNKDHILSKQEVMDLFMKLPNNNLSPDHIEGLFKQMDTNNNGEVTFEEFFAYLFPK
jgi:hypothetical protein